MESEQLKHLPVDFGRCLSVVRALFGCPGGRVAVFLGGGWPDTAALCSSMEAADTPQGCV